MASITAKIKKLLALSTSPNEHEAKTAMLKAQELMVRHKLSMKDVETEEQQQQVTMGVSNHTYTQAKWKPALANVIANNFRCHSIGRQSSGRQPTRICFVGLEDDVDIAMAVYTYAMKFVTSETGRLKRQFYKSTGSAKGIEMSYAFGFVRGLKEQYEEQIESDSMYAMVLVKDQRVDDFINEHTTTKSVIQATSKNFNGFAAMLGFSDGKTFSTSDKLTGETHGQFT